jgi:FAD/FMN-containing dehydrogenase
VMRERKKKARLDLRNFNQVISIDESKKEAEVEGCTNFFDLVKETLKHGLIPKVVPEFRAITIGGAISGLGLESSSFKYGIVQENVKEITMLSGKGIITCSPKQYPDLFNALPNSFGSLGYVLKCKIDLIKCKKYVKMQVLKFTDPKIYFKELNRNLNVDFMDGVVFSPNHMVLVLGTFSDSVPKNEKQLNLYRDVFYVCLQKSNNKDILYLDTANYLFRWDKDAFWGIQYSKPISPILHNKITRQTALRPILRSDRHLALKKVIDWFSPKDKYEELIQDIGLQPKQMPEFLNWYDKNVGAYPVWICPLKKMKPNGTYPLFDFKGKIIVDFGFYTRLELKPGMSKNHHVRIVDAKIMKMGGMKGLYSKNTYSEKEFWQIYDKNAYMKAKKKYDPKGIFPDVYQKIIRE